MLAIGAALAVALAAGCGGGDDGEGLAERSGSPPATAAERQGAGAGANGREGQDEEAPAGAGAEGSSGSGSGSGGSGSGAGGSGSGEDEPAVGEELAQSPPEPQRSGDAGPVLEIRGGRCSPRTVEVPAQQSLTVRNRGTRAARFQIRRARTDVPVPKRSALQVLLPPGRHTFVCRVGDRRTTGSVTVARPGG